MISFLMLLLEHISPLKKLRFPATSASTVGATNKTPLVLPTSHLAQSVPEPWRLGPWVFFWILLSKLSLSPSLVPLPIPRYSSLVLLLWQNTLTKSKAGRKGFTPSYSSKVPSIIAGTKTETIEECWLLTCSPWFAQLAVSFSATQDHLSRIGTTYSRMG